MDEKGRRIVIPVHPGRDVKPGLIRAIIEEAGLGREDFFRLPEEQWPSKISWDPARASVLGLILPLALPRRR